MREYIPVTVVCCLFAAFAQGTSVFFAQTGTIKRKSRFFYICIAVVLVLFAGLRTYYNDTQTYKHIYEQLIIDESFWKTFRWNLGDNPGYYLFAALLKSLGVSTQSYLLVNAVITAPIFVWFLREYSDEAFLSVFLFFVLGCTSFLIAAMKQGVAIAFGLVGIHYSIKGKWGRFLFWILMAATFHPYALMYLLTPFLMFAPWSWKTYILLGAFGAVGFLLESFLGTIVSITSMIGEEYSVTSFEGEGVHPLRLAVLLAPVLVSFIAQEGIRRQHDKVKNLVLNLTMVNAEIMFVALFGEPIYFGRLSNYFLIFQTLSLPYLFSFFERKSRTLVTVAAMLCYGFFFWYENHGFFDIEFDRVTLWHYIGTLIN